MKALRFLRTLDSPSAFAWQTWAVAYAPSVSTAVLHDRNLYGGTVFEWLLVAVIGALGAGAVLLLGHLVLRGRHPVVVLLGTFFLAGCVRGLGVGWSADLLGLVPDPQFGVRALSGGILGIFWLSVATLIVHGFRRHRATRLELEELEERCKAEHRAAAEDLTRLNTRTRVDVTEQIQQIEHELHEQASDVTPGKLLETAERLHDLSEQVVRPLSHQAAMPDESRAPMRATGRRRGYSTILRDAVTIDPFRPGWTLALLLPSILMTAVRGYGFLLGALGALWIAGMAALTLTLAERTFGRRLRHIPLMIRAILVVGIWFVAAAASATPVAIASVRQLGPADAWAVFGIPLFAYVPVMCFGLAIAGAITQAWALDEDARRSRIETLAWQTQRLNQQVWAERKRLGRFLHGSVQSSLTSTALLIETSVAKEMDPGEIARQAGLRLRSVLDATAAPTTSGLPGADIALTLDRVAQVWSRLADISIDVTDAVERTCALDIDAAEATIEVAREGITNAIRHGNADSVMVRVQHDGQALALVVTDNGSFSAASRAGLGTSMLDSMCTTWSRERSADGGTVLECRIPCAGSPAELAQRA